MAISSELSEKIEAILKNFLANPESLVLNFDAPVDLKKLAAELNILPLSINFSTCYGIRLDGQIAVLDFNEDHIYTLVKLEREPRICRTIWFKAAKKYPELSEFMPNRPSNSVSCNSCNGTGFHSINEALGYDEERIVCWCGGLGWLPKDEKQ